MLEARGLEVVLWLTSEFEHLKLLIMQALAILPCLNLSLDCT